MKFIHAFRSSEAVPTARRLISTVGGGGPRSMVVFFGLMAPITGFAGNDVDRDGVNDNFDNCPMAFNAGQSDADGDGIGNACDVVINTGIVVGELPAGQQVMAEDAQSILIAEILNNTLAPKQYTVSSSDRRLDLARTVVTIPPGEHYPVRAGYDSTGFRSDKPDRMLSTHVSITGADASATAHQSFQIISSTAGSCTWKVSWASAHSAMVDDYGDELELDSAVEVLFPQADRAGRYIRSYTLGIGSERLIDALLGSETVDEGSTVVFDWNIHHVEHDAGSPDGFGSASDAYAFFCAGSGSDTFTRSVGFDDDSSVVDYTFTVEWESVPVSGGCSYLPGGAAPLGAILSGMLGLVAALRRRP